ncbi:MAG: hypothetical protein ACMZ7B_11410 [Balneola sp.]
MKTLLQLSLTLIILITTRTVSVGQTVFETASTDDNFLIESWWVKPLDPEYKFTLFNLNTAEYNYELEEAILMSYSIISYNAFKGFGPALGTRILPNKLVALGGIQYTFYREKFFVTANFTSEIKDKPDFEFFSIIQYRPKITNKLKGFFQGQFSFNFNSDIHLLSFQQLRLGADLGLAQTGLAVNQFQFGSNWDYDFQPGLFLRFEFNNL